MLYWLNPKISFLTYVTWGNPGLIASTYINGCTQLTLLVRGSLNMINVVLL